MHIWALSFSPNNDCRFYIYNPKQHIFCNTVNIFPYGYELFAFRPIYLAPLAIRLCRLWLLFAAIWDWIQQLCEWVLTRSKHQYTRLHSCQCLTSSRMIFACFCIEMKESFAFSLTLASIVNVKSRVFDCEKRWCYEVLIGCHHTYIPAEQSRPDSDVYIHSTVNIVALSL